MYNEEMGWNQKTHNPHYLKIIENFKEYGYQDLDLGMIVHHFLNNSQCDKLSKLIVTLKAAAGKYKMNIDSDVAFTFQYINMK